MNRRLTQKESKMLIRNPPKTFSWVYDDIIFKYTYLNNGEYSVKGNGEKVDKPIDIKTLFNSIDEKHSNFIEGVLKGYYDESLKKVINE